MSLNYLNADDVNTPGISESHPIVISDMPDAKTPPKERTSRWGPDRGATSLASQLKNISEFKTSFHHLKRFYNLGSIIASYVTSLSIMGH